MLVLSFDIKGEFASFRDPSITSNQTVYYIPSKSAVLGIIGAIIGIERPHSFEQQFSESYLELLKQTWIGLEVLSQQSRKITFYTNHRSLKESKTKPFKKEVLQFPNYRIYVQIGSENIVNELFERIQTNNFEYSPYLGHTYCPARLSDPFLYTNCIEEKLTDYNENENENDIEYKFKTFSVILDESENYQPFFEIEAQRTDEESSIIIERHMHHFFQNGELQQRVLKFWIPISSNYIVTMFSKPQLCKIVKLENDSTICLY